MNVLAHAAHWYHSLLYLAPVAIVVIALAVQSLRDRRADAAAPPPERPAAPPPDRPRPEL